MSSYSSSSLFLVIQFSTATTDSAVKHISLFKPLNLSFQKGRSIQRHLNHHAPCQNSVKPLRLRCSTPSSGGDHLHDDDAIVLHVRGMMCEGCASSVKKILETQPEVLSATVNLASETALVLPLLSEDKTQTDWQKKLGETLAHHLTTCGFTTTLKDQEDSD